MGLPQVRQTRIAIGRLALSRRKFLQQRQKGERGQVTILNSWWEYKKLSGGNESGKEDAQERMRELEEIGWKWRQELDGFDIEGESTMTPVEIDRMLVPCGRSLHLDRLPKEMEKLRNSSTIERNDEEDDELPAFGLYSVLNPAAFYSMPLLEVDLVKAHLPRFYLDAIDSL